MVGKLFRKYTNTLELLLVFIGAASVRLTELGVFRAIDEEDRWCWAVDLFHAILEKNLPATLIGDGYPGVFPAWLETLWLFVGALVRSVKQGGWIDRPDVDLLIHNWGQWSNLAMQRFPIALANTVLVVLIFWYVRQLFGIRVAWLSAIFISFDPFLLSDSRVNRAEALLTGLMAVSLLALILYYYENNRHQFAISALFGGLAWLTKLQAIVLLPMFGVIHLLWLSRTEKRRQTSVWHWLGVMIAWSTLAVLTFVVLWPAVWTVPADTFGLMFKFATRKVGETGVNLFFWGHTFIDQDPGWLFYPVIFLLRIAPLALIGLLVGVVMFAKNAARQLSWNAMSLRKLRVWVENSNPAVWSLALYAVLYIAGMSLGSHKQDRFLMTIFPVVDVLAALAFVRFAEMRHWQPRRWLVAGGVMLVLQLAIVLPYHPYYFSYFNPLLGGGSTATKLTRIGWGEGMDQVAGYLNSLENPETLRVSARFYKYMLNFKGTAFNLDASGQWLHADKIVFYIQQVQRMEDPSPGVIRYFQQHIPPEKIIRINGINYAWVYPNPVQYPAEPLYDRIDGKLALYGYRWQSDADGARATLVWENLGLHTDPVSVRLIADDNTPSAWVDCSVAPGFENTAASVGEIVESVCILSGSDLPAGRYSLQVGLHAEDSPPVMDFPAGWAAISADGTDNLRRVSSKAAFSYLATRTLPTDAIHLARMDDGKVKLLGYQLSPMVLKPGQPFTLTLFWQAMQIMDEKYPADVSVQAFLGENQVLLKNGTPVSGTRPIPSWHPGEVIADEWQLVLPADVPVPSALRLDVNLFNPDTLTPWQSQNLDGTDAPGEIAILRVVPDVWQSYRGDTPLNVTFGDTVRLDGKTQIRSVDGQSLDVTLFWHALAPLSEDYTAFVHLVAPDGSLLAQSDVQPANGLYPTSVWQPGDIVQSFHRLVLPVDLPAGKYTLLAGLYHSGDWVRLPAVDGTENALPNDMAIVGEFEKSGK